MKNGRLRFREKMEAFPGGLSSQSECQCVLPGGNCLRDALGEIRAGHSGAKVTLFVLYCSFLLMELLIFNRFKFLASAILKKYLGHYG